MPSKSQRTTSVTAGRESGHLRIEWSGGRPATCRLQFAPYAASSFRAIAAAENRSFVFRADASRDFSAASCSGRVANDCASA